MTSVNVQRFPMVDATKIGFVDEQGRTQLVTLTQSQGEYELR